VLTTEQLAGMRADRDLVLDDLRSLGHVYAGKIARRTRGGTLQNPEWTVDLVGNVTVYDIQPSPEMTPEVAGWFDNDARVFEIPETASFKRALAETKDFIVLIGSTAWKPTRYQPMAIGAEDWHRFSVQRDGVQRLDEPVDAPSESIPDQVGGEGA